jgi:hypothetical protein
MRIGNILFSVILFIAGITYSTAQDFTPVDNIDTTTLINTSGKFRIDGSFTLGAGLKRLTVGKTTDNVDVTMSGGGGMSGMIGLDYGITSSIEFNATGGYQFSSLVPQVKNAEGSFSRIIFLTGLKYTIPVASSNLIKIGGGFGYYIPGDLDVDISSVSGGGHNIYSYDGNAGIHLTCDYETFDATNLSWGMGLKYYNVSYDLNSFTSNGISFPIALLPQTVKDQTMKLDGSGIDLTVFIVFGL